MASVVTAAATAAAAAATATATFFISLNTIIANQLGRGRQARQGHQASWSIDPPSALAGGEDADAVLH